MLRIRNEKFRRGFALNGILPHISDDAHDFAPRRRRRSKANMLTKRVAVAKNHVREPLVEHRNALSVRHVPFTESAPAQ